jgi:hypothetical protein
LTNTFFFFPQKMRKLAISAALIAAVLLSPLSASAERIIPCGTGDSIVREDKDQTSSPVQWEQYQLCANQGIATTWFQAFEIGMQKTKNTSHHPAVSWNLLGFWEKQ